VRPEECINKMQILFYKYTNYSFQQLFIYMGYVIVTVYKILSRKIISMISLSFERLTVRCPDIILETLVSLRRFSSFPENHIKTDSS